MATPRTPGAELYAIEKLADAIMDGKPTKSIKPLAVDLDIDYSRLKIQIRLGVLPIVRVSPRRLVVTRAGLIAYLCAVNGLEVDSSDAAPLLAAR